MKKMGVLIFVTGVMSLTACGPSGDDPEKKFRDQGLVPTSTPVNTTKVEYRYTDSRVTVFQQVDSTDPRGASDEGQIVLQNAVFKVTHKDNITFTDGKAGEFEFTVAFTKPKVTFEIDKSTVPAGAEVSVVSTKANSGTFKFKYTPANVIRSGQPDFEAVYKLALKDVKFENTTDQKSFDSLALKTRDIPFVVRKDDNKPTLKVVGLDGDRKAGEVYGFTVEVTAPKGYTGEPLAPTFFYDTTNLLNDKNQIQQDGHYFIRPDSDKGAVEIAKGQWRFFFIFDTKNVEMLQQLDKDFKVVPNATKLSVRVSLRVESEKVAVSDKTTLQFNVNLNP